MRVGEPDKGHIVRSGRRLRCEGVRPAPHFLTVDCAAYAVGVGRSAAEHRKCALVDVVGGINHVGFAGGEPKGCRVVIVLHVTLDRCRQRRGHRRSAVPRAGSATRHILDDRIGQLLITVEGDTVLRTQFVVERQRNAVDDFFKRIGGKRSERCRNSHVARRHREGVARDGHVVAAGIFYGQRAQRVALVRRDRQGDGVTLIRRGGIRGNRTVRRRCDVDGIIAVFLAATAGSTGDDHRRHLEVCVRRGERHRFIRIHHHRVGVDDIGFIANNRTFRDAVRRKCRATVQSSRHKRCPFCIFGIGVVVVVIGERNGRRFTGLKRCCRRRSDVRNRHRRLLRTRNVRTVDRQRVARGLLVHRFHGDVLRGHREGVGGSQRNRIAVGIRHHEVVEREARTGRRSQGYGSAGRRLVHLVAVHRSGNISVGVGDGVTGIFVLRRQRDVARIQQLKRGIGLLPALAGNAVAVAGAAGNHPAVKDLAGRNRAFVQIQRDLAVDVDGRGRFAVNRAADHRYGVGERGERRRDVYAALRHDKRVTDERHRRVVIGIGNDDGTRAVTRGRRDGQRDCFARRGFGFVRSNRTADDTGADIHVVGRLVARRRCMLALDEDDIINRERGTLRRVADTDFNDVLCARSRIVGRFKRDASVFGCNNSAFVFAAAAL